MVKYNSPTNSENFFPTINDILCDIEFVRKSKKHKISNVASVFDIEATSFYENGEKRACMYAWVFGLNGRCIRGRTWEEFFEVLDVLKKTYNLSLKNRLVIYIHNLSYEFQWFRKYFDWEKVFSVDNRKPLYAVTKCGIEFRCSYLLSGYSLSVLGENLTKYKVRKKVGDLDYSLMRHTKTKLTDKEWGYILNDGLVVMAHIQEEIERLGGIKNIPLTKTGYVRELCKEKCLKGANRWTFIDTIKSLKLDVQTYLLLKRTYMGGFTHANINYVGEEIEFVDSFDFTSSYPAVIVSERFPMSSPIRYEIKNGEELYGMLKKYCCMFDIKIHNIVAKVTYENYISISRCRNAQNYIVNNGRVVEADYIETSITEQDFFIMLKMYDWDAIEITNFYYFKKGYLPKDIILTVLELYKDKTELKGVEDKIVEYLVSKGMINSIYGMCVTDICKDEITYGEEWGVEKVDIEGVISAYNENRQRFLYYAWGVWITAYARRNLFTGIIEFKNDYIYSDTDSLKVINTEAHKSYIEKYNKYVTYKIEKCLKYHNIPLEMSRPKTIKGVEKPLGVWDYEGRYDRFKTLGAKRYMIEKDGNIEITIAGVNKKAGVEYLKYKYKTNDNIFKNFTQDLYFPSHYDCDGEDKNGSGKMCHTYIDEYTTGVMVDYQGVKWIYNEMSCIHLENTDYSLTLEAEFIKLLLGVKEGHIA